MSIERYDYSAMTPESVEQEMSDAIEAADALVAQAVAAKPPSFDTTLRPLSDAGATVFAGAGRSFFPGRFHPDRTVRDAASTAEQQFQGWLDGLVERDDVAAAVAAFAETDEARGLTATRRRVLELWQRELRRAGHGLDKDSRRELTELRRRMVELAVQFQRNVGEWRDEIVLEGMDQEGLPAAFLEQLPDGPTAGTKKVPMVYETVWPFLEQSPRRDLRRKVLSRYLARAAAQNRPILEELLGTRGRVASLMGYDSWSDYANSARMSGSAAAVQDFLDRLIGPLQQRAASERERMRQQLAASGIDDQPQAWDWPYLHERQRLELGVSTAELREYLPIDAALSGFFELAQRVFGLAVRELPEVPGWHPDMRVFAVDDDATGEHRFDVYLDLFNREGKPPGAWTFTLRPADNRPGAPRQPAAMAFASNFAPAKDGGPALLEHHDVETLFHEFGHVLEFGLERTAVFNVLPSWVEVDYVEAPSQIMENWAWEPEVLGRFARHHQTGATMPVEFAERLKASRRLNSATATLWHYVYRAVLDQLLHGPDPLDPEEAYRQAHAVTGFAFVEGAFVPSAFTHIAGWYDAGFYSYLWARVFGDDMFSAFSAEGVMSPEAGRRYRAEVLEPSWSKPGRERTHNFLGREPSEQAFLEALGVSGA